MDETEIRRLMDLALKVAGHGWEHGLVLESPRGSALLSMSLSVDCNEPNNGHPVSLLALEPHDSSPEGIEMTEVAYGNKWSPAMLVSMGWGNPEVVLFKCHRRHDAIAVARRFGGCVCMDHQGPGARMFDVPAEREFLTLGMLPAFAFVQEGVRALLLGAATETARAAEKAMEACGLVMGTGMREAVMRAVTNQPQSDFRNLAGRALNDVSLCVEGEGSDEWTSQDDGSDCLLEIKNDACKHVLHGIVTGAGDDAVVEAALGSMERDVDGIRVSPGIAARAKLLAAVQALRTEMTGCGLDPMAQELSLPMP